MESDATKTPPRTGAAAAPSSPPPAGYERLLRRRAKPFSAELFLTVADWLHAERQKTGRTQKEVALHHRIPLRQVKTYEAVARWPREAKTFVKANPDLFRVSDLTRQFANRSWRNKEALLNALRRHAVGKPPRKRRGANSGAATDPDIVALQNRLRDRLQTRVEISGDGRAGELRITFFSPDELERVLGILGA
jgi:hypothetical protein